MYYFIIYKLFQSKIRKDYIRYYSKKRIAINLRFYKLHYILKCSSDCFYCCSPTEVMQLWLIKTKTHIYVTITSNLCIWCYLLLPKWIWHYLQATGGNYRLMTGYASCLVIITCVYIYFMLIARRWLEKYLYLYNYKMPEYLRTDITGKVWAKIAAEINETGIYIIIVQCSLFIP